MQNIKRTVCFILVLALFATLASCGSKEDGIDYLVLVNKENKLPVGNVAPPADET